MAERAAQQRATAGPAAEAARTAAGGGALHALGEALGRSPRVASLRAVSAQLAAAPGDADAPVQLVLNNALPGGNFFKGALAGYMDDIDASIATIRANWRLMANRYDLLRRGGVAVNHVAAYARLAETEAPAIITALHGKFTDKKRQELVAAYNAIRQAEGGNLAQQAEAQLAAFTDLDQVALQQNSANRVIQDLEGRRETAGGTELFGNGGMIRAAANRWTFTQPGPQAWEIRIASDNAATARVRVAVDGGARRINVTIDRHPVPNSQKDVQERRIADAIAFQFRTHKGVGGGSVFAAGAGAGALTHTDNEKVATLQLLYQRYNAEKALFDAAPDNAGRRVRMQQIVAHFDATVQEMNLDNAAKRTLLERFPGLEADDDNKGVGVKAAAHGMFHENRAQSQARGLGDPLADAAAHAVRVISPELIEHMIAVSERNSVQEFEAMGLNGGHDTTRLQNFVRAHPAYALAPAGTRETEVTLGGAEHMLRVRTFRQYRWIGGGNPPDALNARPPMDIRDTHWAVAGVPKTTVDDLFVFLQEGRQAYLNWRLANVGSVADASFGKVPGAPAHTPTAAGPSGPEFAGFVRADRIASEPGRAIRKLDTLFVTG